MGTDGLYEDLYDLLQLSKFDLRILFCGSFVNNTNNDINITFCQNVTA